MLEKAKLKLWQWLLLLLIGFLFPLYNILLNNMLLSMNLQIAYYIISVMVTTVIFSFILFIVLNTFRKKTGYEKRMDTAFMLYVLSVSFGSFFKDMTTVIGLFVLPFLIAYFLEIKNILNDFPRE
jgi:hypothetical protein